MGLLAFWGMPLRIFGGPERTESSCFWWVVYSSPLSSQSLSQLDIFWHDCHSLVCMAQRLVSSKILTMYASVAWRATMASAVNLHSPLPKFWANSHTNCWNGSFLIRSLVDFWYLLISQRAMVPGLYQCGFLTPPIAATAALFLAAAAVLIDLALGCFPPVGFFGVCFICAMLV